MRRAPIVVSLSLSLLAGCSSDESAPPLFGGFDPQDGAAVLFAPVVCDVPFAGTFSVSGIGVVLTSYAGTCDVLAATQLCGTEASSIGLVGIALSGEPGTGGVDPAGPGTYRYRSSPPTGPFLAASADADEVDDQCAATGRDPGEMTGGSITVSSVDAERVAGAMSLRFENGQVFEDAFDVAICPVTIDVCDMLRYGCSGEYACVHPL